MKFKKYFNAYDTSGTRHTGFLQSIDFSALTTDITMLNELTMAIIDAHLFNELSGSLVLRQWREYMTYSKEHDRHEINAGFYADFVNALAAKLYKSEKWFKLLSTDFKSLSATDIKTITHGTKETDRDYGQAETTKEYGQDETATEYGATETATEYGATETATEYGAKTKTKQYDRVEVTVTRDMDTHVVGATQTDTDATTTNKLYPLGGSAYVDDTQSVTDQTVTTNSQSNTDTWGDQETATAARTDTDTDALHTDTTTGALHTDTTTEALHTDTTTRAARTDTETKAARKDTETIKTYTDTEQHVKHILINPEKYYQIEKELADIGVYDLMLEAVKETMLLSVWEEDCFVW